MTLYGIEFDKPFRLGHDFSCQGTRFKMDTEKGYWLEERVIEIDYLETFVKGGFKDGRNKS